MRTVLPEVPAAGTFVCGAGDGVGSFKGAGSGSGLAAGTGSGLDACADSGVGAGAGSGVGSGADSVTGSGSGMGETARSGDPIIISPISGTFPRISCTEDESVPVITRDTSPLQFPDFISSRDGVTD